MCICKTNNNNIVPCNKHKFSCSICTSILTCVGKNSCSLHGLITLDYTTNLAIKTHLYIRPKNRPYHNHMRSICRILVNNLLLNILINISLKIMVTWPYIMLITAYYGFKGHNWIENHYIMIYF